MCSVGSALCIGGLGCMCGCGGHRMPFPGSVTTRLFYALGIFLAAVLAWVLRYVNSTPEQQRPRVTRRATACLQSPTPTPSCLAPTLGRVLDHRLKLNRRQPNRRRLRTQELGRHDHPEQLAAVPRRVLPVPRAVPGQLWRRHLPPLLLSLHHRHHDRHVVPRAFPQRVRTTP